MTDIVDLLKIKIEKAKRELPLETANAIDAIDWRNAILGLRSKYGYTFEQLGDLELETELLLCGLVSPENYPKELENRMKISKAQANELVNEMNNSVFKKIMEELIKNTERKRIFVKNEKSNADNAQILSSAGIEIIPGKLELTGETHPMLAEKLSSSVQIPTVKTNHSLNNITKTIPPSSYPPKADPYRLPPEE